MNNMTGVPAEESEQKALFEWAELAWHALPGLELMFAIPNGGKRSLVTAAMLKATGVKAGVPDICLPVARGGYHGLYIELKRIRGGRVSPDQQEWIRKLNEQGYLAIVCKGFYEAQWNITAYLHGKLSLKGD